MYTYQLLKGPWGIRVTIAAMVGTCGSEASTVIPVGEAVNLEVPPGLTERLGKREIDYLARGLRLALPHLGIESAPRSITVEEVWFVETDFQAEGLSMAAYYWLGSEYGMDLPEISARFDRKLNRYVFDFPD